MTPERRLVHRGHFSGGIAEIGGCDSDACSKVARMISTPLPLAAARYAAMFWSGSTTVTQAPAATSGRVTCPVPILERAEVGS